MRINRGTGRTQRNVSVLPSVEVSWDTRRHWPDPGVTINVAFWNRYAYLEVWWGDADYQHYRHERGASRWAWWKAALWG